MMRVWRIIVSVATLGVLAWVLPVRAQEAPEKMSLPQCDAFRKLIRCRLAHTAPAERTTVRPRVLASLTRVEKAIRSARRSDRKQIAELCAQQTFETKRVLGHKPWFGKCLLMVRGCPQGAVVRQQTRRGIKRMWCEKTRGRKSRRKHGPAFEWHVKGRLAMEGGFAHGRKHGRWVRYYALNMFKRSEGLYRKGRRHGLWIFYSRDGRERGKQAYRKGIRHGRFTSYRPNGKFEYIGRYVNGKKHGLWIYWNRKGRKTHTETWKLGRKKEVLYHDRRGRTRKVCMFSGRKMYCKTLRRR